MSIACCRRMQTNYPEHMETFSYLGRYRYSLTFCTDRRKPFFTDAGNVELVVSQLLRSAADQRFDVIAYCFMPDHLHVIAIGTADDADLKAFVKRAKQFSGFYFKQKTGQRLWQRYGYEHVIRNDESTQQAVRYVLENPLRQGLAKSVGDYPFIGSSRYSREELIEYIRIDVEEGAGFV